MLEFNKCYSETCKNEPIKTNIKFICNELPGTQWYCASRYFIVPGHGSENKLVFAWMLQFLFSLHLNLKKTNEYQKSNKNNIININYLACSSGKVFVDMQLTLQSVLPWSLQTVIEYLPYIALSKWMISPSLHSNLRGFPSQA